MATTHIVKRGENLPMIAKKYGFHDWKTIYDHPNNREFRKKRPNPNLILPGDQLFIPDKTAVPKPKAEFHLSVKDKLSGNNFPNLTLQLVLPTGITKQYLTDSSGIIDLKEPEVIAGKVDIVSLIDIIGNKKM